MLLHRKLACAETRAAVVLLTAMPMCRANSLTAGWLQSSGDRGYIVPQTMALLAALARQGAERLAVCEVVVSSVTPQQMSCSACC